MAYIAQWMVLVQGDGIDPVEVARQARELSLDPANDAWRIIDIETQESCVVSIIDNRVVPPGGGLVGVC
jgi:hypothetical protein